jgi:hypothetical protein
MNAPFWIDQTCGDAYGAALLRKRFLFLAADDTTITTDPTAFAIEAFKAASPPTGYVRFPSPIGWARLYRRSADGPLFAYVRVMTRPIEPLMKLDGWSGWVHRDGYLCEPADEEIAQVPVMLTSTLLLFAISADRLHVPQDAPRCLTVQDAEASVAQLVEALNERVRPVLKQLEGM